MGKSFALYTTYYPEVVDYLPQWVESFHAQTDKNIDICIGVDGKDSSYIGEMLGRQVSPQFILAMPGETPTSLRSRALEILSSEFDAVILSDMDDILLPTRIVTAKEQLSKCDLSCCAMQIMNIDKLINNKIFDPNVLGNQPIRRNVFGLTNTAWQSSLLKRCLPVPSDYVLMDWLIAIRARAENAIIGYDSEPRMIYRQHPKNTARIIPPFSAEQVLQGCRLVLSHYDFILKESCLRYPHLTNEIKFTIQLTKDFQSALKGSTRVLKEYIDALNRIPHNYVWWDFIANPKLEIIWKH